MTAIRAGAGSKYMQWAKLQSTAKYNLATSGMVGLPLSVLGVSLDQLEINGPTIYGYDPLLKAIAGRYRVPKECVVSTMGTSFANYLALAGATEPGDEILMEQPAYDPMLGAARFLGLHVKRFQRRAEQDFAIDLAEVERNLSSRTRLIVLCNFHNPSGAFTPDSVLKDLAALARSRNAYVLVDEVYREMLFEPEPHSAFLLDPERFIITDSLTKAYGLSGLRCGWILAPRTLAERMWRIHDVHAATWPFVAEYLSVIAFEKLPEIAQQQKCLLGQNRAMLKSFLGSRDDLDCFFPEYGTVIFPRLKHGKTAEFCEALRTEFETSVVPGEFFEMPDHFRVGVGVPSAEVQAGLEQLGKGLDTYKSSLVTGLKT